MDWQTNILEDNGIVMGAEIVTGFDALIAGERDTGSFQAAPRALTEGLEDSDVDPRLAAFWLWEYGAAAPVQGRDGEAGSPADGPMPFYVPLVAARDGGSLVEGAEYIGESELRSYLHGDIANDNWLVRRLK